MERVVRIIHKMSRWATFFIGAGLLFGMLLIIWGIILRSVFHTYVSWIFDITTFITIGTVYLGAAYTFQVKGHVYVDLIVSRLPRRAQGIFGVAASLIALFLFSFLTWVTWASSWEALTKGLKYSSFTQPPLFPVKMVLPIGAGLLCLEILVDLARNVALSLGKRVRWLPEPAGKEP